MRIEILVDNEEPKIYPSDRPKIVVGAHESCDIVIPHKSISRKHLVITSKDDKYFVADQGSMNGSYINEHRLVPGTVTEFTSFFPVRLGDNVLVTLLSDEEAREIGDDSTFNTSLNSGSPVVDEATKVISLKDLNKKSTNDLVKKRTVSAQKRKIAEKKVTPKKEQALSSNRLIFIIVIMLAGAAYFQFIWNRSEPQVIAEVGKEKEAEVVVPVVVDNSPIKRLELEGLIPAEKILAGFSNFKCTTEVEKFVCTALPEIYQGKGGTVLIDKTIVFYVEGNQFETDAKTFLKAPLSIEEGGTKEAWDSYYIDLNLMIVMLWMHAKIPVEVKDMDKLKDYSIAVAILNSFKDEIPKLITTVFIVPESFARLRKNMQEKHFVDAKKNGPSEFFYAHEYLRFP